VSLLSRRTRVLAFGPPLLPIVPAFSLWGGVNRHFTDWSQLGATIRVGPTQTPLELDLTKASLSSSPTHKRRTPVTPYDQKLHIPSGEQRFAHLRFEMLPEEVDSLDLYLGTLSTGDSRFEIPRIGFSKARGLYLIPATLPLL
jgi:hypothetical protein